MRTQWEIENAFASKEELSHVRSFYFVGIGGASMSALAKMLRSRGYAVSGSDSTPSPVTAELMSMDIPITIGHTGENIRKGDAIILSDAIDLKTNPEVLKAQELECPLFRRSQLLGWMLKGRKVIAVTGTHGKTTTTGLVSSALIAAGFDPLCVEGAIIPDWGGPVRDGEGEWAVIEACEAYNSLRDYDPYVVVLTNLELDHDDFYTGGYEQLRDTVLQFVNRIPLEGALIYCVDDPGAAEVARLATCRSIPYGNANMNALLGDSKLRIPGKMNRLNAAGALTAATWIGADLNAAREGVSTFTGAERRLQFVAETEDGITVYDDYAHHPTEIEASIKALREISSKRLVVVYQPHLYSRTAAYLDGFAKALNLADHVVLTDIYPAREDPIPGISSARIAEQLTVPVTYVPSRFLLPRVVSEMAMPGDLVVGMGAGNIDAFVKNFIPELGRRKSEAKKILVAYGGDSPEREVSILSGRAIAGALKEKGYEVTLKDLSEIALSSGNLSFLVGTDRPDVVFLAVHGSNAEDGAIQGLLEFFHIPYTGSKIQASAIAMDKALTKDVLQARGLPVPKGKVLTHPFDRPALPNLPVVVKPNAQGSTVGLSIVQSEEALEAAIRKAFQYGDTVLVEEFIEGMEISVPVLGDMALPPVEICAPEGNYDFAAKYTVGATEEICPARISEELLAEAKRLALESHRAVGAEGATRTDMIVEKNGRIVVLEVNTLPGMTSTSLLPKSAEAAGIPFADLCQRLVEDAWSRRGAKS